MAPAAARAQRGAAVGDFAPLTLRLDFEERESTPCLSPSSQAKMVEGVRRLVPLDVALMLWGLGTWLGVNGLYMQLPLLVERLPEGWALPASMAVAIQIANVGVFAYAAARRLLPRVSDAPFIYSLLAVGTAALALNAFLYEETVPVGGTDRSIAFLALTFFAALVGCTSSVLFYPYLRHFRDVYLATYLVGEGLSGFVPSVLALVQGVGGDPECVLGPDGVVHAVTPPPRFDSTVFMLLLAALSAVSLASFITITAYGGFDSERVAPAAAAKDEEATVPRVSLLSARWLTVLVVMAALNALANGVLPSVQSYSCMPYGATAYHLAVTLGAMANPAACLAGVWLVPVSGRVLAGMLVATGVPLAYILATALLSPEPPLMHSGGGVALVVICWVVVHGVVSYARMWIYGWARSGGTRGMRACGAITQLGSALGSAVLFALVNFTEVFTQAYYQCPSPAGI